MVQLILKFVLDTGSIRCYTHFRKAKALWRDPRRFFRIPVD